MHGADFRKGENAKFCRSVSTSLKRVRLHSNELFVCFASVIYLTCITHSYCKNFQAVDEPGFAVEYAKMCKNLQDKKIKDPGSGELVNFRKLLITRCQIEFQKDYMEGIDPQKLKEEVTENIFCFFSKRC